MQEASWGTGWGTAELKGKEVEGEAERKGVEPGEGLAIEQSCRPIGRGKLGIVHPACKRNKEKTKTQKS